MEDISRLIDLSDSHKRELKELAIEGLFFAEEQDLEKIKRDVYKISNGKIIYCSLGDNYIFAIATHIAVSRTYTITALKKELYNKIPIRRRFEIF